MPEADNAKINTVASGVRVMLVNVAAMRLITIKGDTNEEEAAGINGCKADTKPCANDAPFESKGNMTPPGNFPADANAIAKNLAIPICSAAIPDAYGRFGSTFANWFMI